MGVGMVHQHFMLVPSFTVAQNIVMSREPRRLGVLFDNKAAEAAAQRLVEEYGLAVDPAAVVREIGVGLQQRVEILKTLYRGADILILDEPTAVLTPQETDELFAVIRRVVRELGHDRHHHHAQALRGHGDQRPRGRDAQGTGSSAWRTPATWTKTASPR